MIRYKIQEGYRRLGQMFVSGYLFIFPGLYSIRVFVYKGLFSIGKSPTIGSNVVFHREHQKKEGRIKIGDNVLLGDNVKIDYSGYVEIHNNVWISESAHIHTHSHPITPDRINKIKDNITTSTLVIEKGVWIGDGAIILDSVDRIGEFSVIAAGSVVTNNIEKKSIVGGVPAKLIKKI